MKRLLHDDNLLADKEDSLMLHQTEWIRINKSCHTLVDETLRVVAIITTSYSESDGDENFIWDVEIEDSEFGAFVGLFNAKLAVQRAISEFEVKEFKRSKRKKVAKKETKKSEPQRKR